MTIHDNDIKRLTIYTSTIYLYCMCNVSIKQSIVIKLLYARAHIILSNILYFLFAHLSSESKLEHK